MAIHISGGFSDLMLSLELILKASCMNKGIPGMEMCVMWWFVSSIIFDEAAWKEEGNMTL